MTTDTNTASHFDLAARDNRVRLTDAEIDAVGGAYWIQEWDTAWNNYLDELASPKGIE
jgi:hypothetical protein